MNKDTTYKKHVLEAIGKIERFMGDLSREQFLDESMVQDAVIRQLEIIGEASKRLSELLKVSTPTIPWKDVVGFRNVLIHDYIDVDLKQVWDTVKNDLPVLKAALQTS